MRLFIWLFLVSFLFAYDQHRLMMNAKIFEKILLLDSDLGSKAEADKQIDILLFYDKTEKHDALRLQRFLEASAQSGFPYPVAVRTVPYHAFDNNPADAYFLLDAREEKTVRSVASYAIAQGIISFAYNYTYLKEGVMLSLKMDQKVYPLINPEALKQSKINFKPILIRIAKQYKP
jgi:hypothetical protein